MERKEIEEAAVKEYMGDGDGIKGLGLFVSGAKFGAQWRAEQSGWVKCEERLPQENQIVLFFDDHNEMAVGFYNGLSFDYSLEDYFVTNYNVTHWQPLPEKP